MSNITFVDFEQKEVVWAGLEAEDLEEIMRLERYRRDMFAEWQSQREDVSRHAHFTAILDLFDSFEDI